jgi:hypothetical protein
MAASAWRLHPLEYLEAPGLSVLAYHNDYPAGRQGGIELIHHGERIAVNGDLHLATTVEGFSALGTFKERRVDKKKPSLEIQLALAKPAVNYTVLVRPQGQSVRVSVTLQDPMPADFPGPAYFILQLFPPAFFGKTFHLGKQNGVFPRECVDPIAQSHGEFSQPIPMGIGKKLVVAPEDPRRHLEIEIAQGTLELVDMRAAGQNGWFTVRSQVPLGKTGTVMEWTITPHVMAGWQRPPVVGVSQAGYHPGQKKEAVIELDPRTKKLSRATVESIGPDGKIKTVLAATPKPWGMYLRHQYAVLDFTRVTKPGMYRIRYGQQVTPPFRIGADVFQQGVWQPTLETFLPVQMCHMEVRDRYRVWHGACHLDDALQAPPRQVHFDQYEQGPQTDSPFTAGEHIPGLDQGGWHDAGDYDLAAGSQAGTTHTLALVREAFGIDSDQTTVDQAQRRVVLRQPDGKPDILQQIEHGVLNLLSGYRVSGHSFCGIIEATRQQYVHLGDASTITDNRVFDARLAANQTDGDRAGKKDDRWAFTTRSTALEYQAATALAAAGRSLRGYNDALAKECIDTAVKAWDFEQNNPPVYFRCEYVSVEPEVQEIMAAVELLLATDDKTYSRRLLELLPGIVKHIASVGWAVARVLSRIKDAEFNRAVEKAVAEYAKAIREEMKKNPYGVLLRPQLWGVAWGLQQQAMGFYYLVRSFPKMFDREMVLRVVNFVLGCHPYSNVSFVSGVGAYSMTSPHGGNRADWSFIPGGEPPGVALVKPDYWEVRSDYPFIWQQAEYVIGGAATYIFCVLAADKLLSTNAHE